MLDYRFFYYRNYAHLKRFNSSFIKDEQFDWQKAKSELVSSFEQLKEASKDLERFEHIRGNPYLKYPKLLLNYTLNLIAQIRLYEVRKKTYGSNKHFKYVLDPVKFRRFLENSLKKLKSGIIKLGAGIRTIIPDSFTKQSPLKQNRKIGYPRDRHEEREAEELRNQKVTLDLNKAIHKYLNCVGSFLSLLQLIMMNLENHYLKKSAHERI